MASLLKYGQYSIISYRSPLSWVVCLPPTYERGNRAMEMARACARPRAAMPLHQRGAEVPRVVLDKLTCLPARHSYADIPLHGQQSPGKFIQSRAAFPSTEPRCVGGGSLICHISPCPRALSPGASSEATRLSSC